MGPRVKETISTAGDRSYGERVSRAAAERLVQMVDEQWRTYWQQLRDYERQLAAHQDDVETAREWIRSHGGTVPKALIKTHPDHGGRAEDLQRTLWAREVLRASAR